MTRSHGLDFSPATQSLRNPNLHKNFPNMEVNELKDF